MLLPPSGLAAGREDGMALDPKAQAALALHRFGLGPRAGSIASIASDPRGALLAELDRPGAGRINNPELQIGRHTSELQSQSNLVCRLLLEKQKHPLRHYHRH